MDAKTFFLRLLVFILVMAGGWATFALVMWGMIKLGIMSADIHGDGFGYMVTNKSSYVYMASALAAFSSIFINANWRYVLLLAPIYAPSLFGIIFTLTQNQAIAPTP